MPFVSGAAGTVSVVFKEFGIRLNFKPTIAGDVIRLHVRPEVSALDFNNGVTISGFRIPALTTRRAETDVELRDGQSFAIAGLLNNISQTNGQEIPILSELPIIGNLFKIESGACGAHRADGADHASTRARARSGRGATAADDARRLSPDADARGGASSTTRGQRGAG